MAENKCRVSFVFLVFVILGTQILLSLSNPLPRTAEDDVESDPAATITPEIPSDISKPLSDESYLKPETLEGLEQTETIERSEENTSIYVDKRSVDKEEDENPGPTTFESYEEDNSTEDSSETTTQNSEDETFLSIEPIQFKPLVKKSSEDNSNENSSEYPESISDRSKRETNQDELLNKNHDSGKDEKDKQEQKQGSEVDIKSRENTQEIGDEEQSTSSEEDHDIIHPEIEYDSRDKRSAPQNKNGIDLGWIIHKK